MRTCVQCGRPIPGKAILNPEVAGPCCSQTCADQARKTHPATLTPGQIGRLAFQETLDLLTPEERAAFEARRKAAASKPTP